MADTQENNLPAKISAEDIFKPSKSDAAHRGMKVGLSGIPIFGGVAAELFGTIVAEPSAKRLEAFLISVESDIENLKEKYTDFSLKDILENDTVVSSMIQATQVASRTHLKEKHEALKNAVLNAALSKSVDSNHQETFIRWIEELTVLHIDLLKIFLRGGSPEFNLENEDWKNNIAVNSLSNWIEDKLPGLEGQFDFYILIIDDLHRKGLLSNKDREKNTLARTTNYPRVTPFAKRFLEAIQSPLDDD